MKWYDHLYLGDSVKHPRRLQWKINHNAGMVGVYVIALASNEQNLLDIIPSWELKQKGYPWKKELRVIGLARGYREAIEVVRRIIEETYENTGGVDVRRWLGEKRRVMP